MRSFSYTFNKLGIFSGVYKSNTIHVKDIVDIYFYKRRFRIFNRDHPYNLDVEIKDLEETTTPVPVLTPRGVGFGIARSVSLTSLIHRRYKTEKEAEEEFEQIKKLRNLYFKYVKESENEFLERHL